MELETGDTGERTSLFDKVMGVRPILKTPAPELMVRMRGLRIWQKKWALVGMFCHATSTVSLSLFTRKIRLACAMTNIVMPAATNRRNTYAKSGRASVQNGAARGIRAFGFRVAGTAP